MNTWLPFASFFLVLAAAMPATAQASPGDLAVRIAPRAPGDGGGDEDFAVVLTNTGSAPIRLWDETYSWGYFNLSYAVAGSPALITRRQIEWEKNFPAFLTLLPGGSTRIAVTLDPAQWQGLPPRGGRAWRITAIYESKPSEEARERAIWIGTSRSSPTTIKIPTGR